MMILKTIISSMLLASLSTASAAEYNASWWPTATADTTNTTVNVPVTIPVLANDLGIDLRLVTVNTSSVGLGSVKMSADRQSVIYTSANGFVGSDSFWYNFVDFKGRANAAKVTVNVSDVNTPMPKAWPDAAYDTAETAPNTPVQINVLENDTGVGLKLTEVNETTVKLGQAVVNADGKTIQYTPPSDYSGDDEFWYVFSDQWGRTNAGKITLTVTAKTTYGGGWPTAVSDTASVVNTATVLIPVLNNDLGDGLTLTKTNATTVKLGQTTIEGNQIRYTPAAGFSGEDSFWYDFEDRQGRANSTQVSVNVIANEQQSSINFCGKHYQTDGTVDGTTITTTAIPPAQNIASTEIRAFPTQQAGDFALVGGRRYYIVENGPNLGTSVWFEENGVNTLITTNPEAFSFYGIGIINDMLYFGASQENIRTTSFYSHDGVSLKALGNFDGVIAALDNQSAPYFTYTGRDESNANGTHFLRISEITKRPVAVEIEFIAFRVNQTVSSLFYVNGVDYSAKFSGVSQTSSSSGSIKIRQRNANGETLNSFPGSIDKAVVSENRLLFTTQAHTDFFGSNRTAYPAKLYAVNNINEITELAVCE